MALRMHRLVAGDERHMIGSGRCQVSVRVGPRRSWPGLNQSERVQGVLDGALHLDGSRIEFLVHTTPLSRPMPCSPLTVPPNAIAASNRSSKAACAAVCGASRRPGGVISEDNDFHHRRGRSWRCGRPAPGDLLDLLEHARHCRTWNTDILGQDGPETLQRGIGESAGSEQGLRLDVVFRLLGPGCPACKNASAMAVASSASRGSGGVDAGQQQCRRARTRCPGVSRPSTARMQASSGNSKAAGCSPLLVHRATACPAATRVSKAPTTVRGGAVSAGRRRSVISVRTPSVPSEPTNRLTRSYPATPFVVRRPSWTGGPTMARASDDGLHPEDVIAGYPVLQAAQAASVGGDIATYRRPR